MKYNGVMASDQHSRPRPSARGDAALRVGVLAAFSLAMAAIIAVYFVVTPEQLERGEVTLSPPCLSAQYLDRECLHCGLTRAFAAISHGQLGRALGYNRLAILFYALVWACALAGAAAGIRSWMQYRQEEP